MSAPLRVSITGLPVSGTTRETLLCEGVDGAVLYLTRQDDIRALVFGPGCAYRDEAAAIRVCGERGFEVTHVWNRHVLPDPVHAGSKTALALAAMTNDPKLTPNAAAKRAGINASAVYRALKRREERGVCSCCGRAL